ncbi:hypothetical protein [Actinospongicola halichondriae]|uniref:hypothetical protein n=1 Tax=Actinospongicola halichondriae TaxID=3236844 RepID=UPI003D5135FC
MDATNISDVNSYLLGVGTNGDIHANVGEAEAPELVMTFLFAIKGLANHARVGHNERKAIFSLGPPHLADVAHRAAMRATGGNSRLADAIANNVVVRLRNDGNRRERKRLTREYESDLFGAMRAVGDDLGQDWGRLAAFNIKLFIALTDDCRAYLRDRYPG